MSLDIQILTALRAARDGSVSGADLSAKLQVSRAAIWAHIQDLRDLGYDIEASPHRGYRLLSVPDVLHADDLLSRLPEDRIVGRDIRVFQETTSTNDVIEKLARDEVREGVVVFADSQSKGRGRLGRKWMSPAGKGLWFSLLLRPPLQPLEATQLTVAAATALRRAIASQTSLQPHIKWPNDILINGRKTAGILTELRAEVDRIKYCIIGIGVDVNIKSSEYPEELRTKATSLKAEAGKPVSRPDLAVAILREIDADYKRITSGKFHDVATEWAAHCATIGSRVTVLMGERRIQGQAEALADDGALLVRTDHGHLERIVGGDIILEK